LLSNTVTSPSIAFRVVDDFDTDLYKKVKSKTDIVKSDTNHKKSDFYLLISFS